MQYILSRFKDDKYGDACFDYSFILLPLKWWVMYQGAEIHSNCTPLSY